MAIAFVRSAVGTHDSSTSIVVTVPAAGFASGNKLVIAAYSADTSAFYSGVADTAGNTYTSRHQYSVAGRSVTILEGNLTNALVSGNSVTGTQPTGGGYMLVAEFSGLLVGTAFDQQNQATSTNTTFSSGATPTTTQADELIFGSVCANASSTATFGATAPYVEIEDRQWTAGTMSMQIQYQIVAATGAYTSTGTISSSLSYFATVDSFKGEAAAGTTFTLPAQNMSPLTWRT